MSTVDRPTSQARSTLAFFGREQPPPRRHHRAARANRRTPILVPHRVSNPGYVLSSPVTSRANNRAWISNTRRYVTR